MSDRSEVLSNTPCSHGTTLCRRSSASRISPVWPRADYSKVEASNGKDRYCNHRSRALWLIGSSSSLSPERSRHTAFRRADVLLGTPYAETNVAAFAMGRLAHRRSRKASGTGRVSERQRQPWPGLSSPSERFHQLWPLVP